MIPEILVPKASAQSSPKVSGRANWINGNFQVTARIRYVLFHSMNIDRMKPNLITRNLVRNYMLLSPGTYHATDHTTYSQIIDIRNIMAQKTIEKIT